MSERLNTLTLAAVMAATVLLALPAAAQKIVCWKDKSGKVIGCGDRVPPEYRQNESKTLDSRGITRETKVSAEEAARLKEEAKKQAALKAEEDRRIAEQRRQDTALINTYTAAKEIDIRRDRELQVVDLQIQQLQAQLRNAAEAHSSQKARYASFEKRGKVPDNVRDDLRNAAAAEENVKARIADREKDKERIAASYAEQKARYIELKGGTAPGSSPAGTKPAPKK